MPEQPVQRIEAFARRHHRQALLGVVGAGGQARLARGHAAVVGCGALGTVGAELLARAGVGRLTLIDRDIVEPTNLQRQTLFTEADAHEGLPKAEAGGRALRAIDGSLDIRAIVDDLNPRTIERILSGGGDRPGVILDGTDNYQTRYLVNDLCARDGIAYVYAGALGTAGMTTTILPGTPGAPWPIGLATPCLRCVFPEPAHAGSGASAQTCDTVGVLGPVTSAIASLQAAEAIKVLIGDYASTRRTLLAMDLWANSVREIDLSGARDAHCPCCARRSFEFLDGSRGAGPVTLCGRSSVQITPDRPARVDLGALGVRLGALGETASNRFLVRATLEDTPGDSGEPVELTVFADGRAIVSGTTSPQRARSIYDRYVGE